MRRSDIAAMVIISCASVFHITACVMPGWWVVDDSYRGSPNTTAYFGIWVKEVCHNGDCVKSPSDRTGEKAWLIGVMASETISLCLFIFAAVSNGILLVRKTGVWLRRLYVVLVSGGGTFILFGILIFVKKKAGLRRTSSLETDGTIGWPLILATVAGLLGLLDGVFVACCIARAHHIKKYNQECIVEEPKAGRPSSVVYSIGE
ncbi:hypothetical protein ScPMuIL_017245 [Solemya velum]